MTLLEVLAGLALLAMLLVAMLAAKDSYARQWVRASRRLEAVAAAEALLADWWKDASKFPRDKTGDLGQNSAFAWETHVVSNPAVERLGGQDVRLEVFLKTRGPFDAPLAHADVVLGRKGEVTP